MSYNTANCLSSNKIFEGPTSIKWGLRREATFHEVPKFQHQVSLEHSLIAITTNGCYLHVYKPESRRWLSLRGPLEANADAVVRQCSEWGESLVVELCGVDDVMILRQLDVATWSWKPPPLLGPVTILGDMGEAMRR